MAKKHKNLENVKIAWNGNLDHPEAGNQGKSIPASVNLGKWAGEYVPCWSNSYDDCVLEDMLYFEDFDIAIDDGLGSYLYIPDGELDLKDVNAWNTTDTTIGNHVIQIIVGNIDTPPKAPISAYTGGTPYTWGDVSFVIEISDGIGTGSRRAREARLNKFEQEKKKRLIRLICRVKGEKVYDEEKEVGDTYIKLEDAELVINEVLGEIKVENANVL